MEKSQLAKTLDELVTWRKNNKVHQSRCLEAVRWALAQNGLRVPGPFPRPRNTAIECYRALSENPETHGWKRWTHADHPGEALPLCLAFFKDCGKLPDGRIAGHIAIYDPAHRKHSANTLYAWNTSWAAKLVGAFVVDEGFARHPKITRWASGRKTAPKYRKMKALWQGIANGRIYIQPGINKPTGCR